MSSVNPESERDVEPPNYTWQRNSPPSHPVYRTKLDIINSHSPDRYQFLRMLFGEMFYSPVSSQLTSGARVLYVHTGELNWIKDMLKIYPNSEFDCITIMDSIARPDDLPEKIKYSFWNIQGKTLYPDSVFDFIHVDTMMFYLRTEEWQVLLLELFRILKPGGFLEMLENEVWAGNMGPTHEIFATTLAFSFRARGIYTRIGREISEVIKKAGFTNISKFHVSAPCGWAPPLGDIHARICKNAIRLMAPFLMKSLGWTEERLWEEHSKVERECVEFKTYFNFYVAYGQKP